MGWLFKFGKVKRGDFGRLLFIFDYIRYGSVNRVLYDVRGIWRYIVSSIFWIFEVCIGFRVRIGRKVKSVIFRFCSF